MARGAQGQQPVLRGLCLALLDEADTLLIDEAAVPLVLARAEADAAAVAFLREAWERLRARLGGLATGIDRLEPAQKGLLPLLHVAAIRDGIVLGSGDATYLRAAHLREELRGNAYRRILTTLLAGLAGPGTISSKRRRFSMSPSHG